MCSRRRRRGPCACPGTIGRTPNRFGPRASIIMSQVLNNAARVVGGVPAIQASQLTKRYGTVDALKGIDLAVEPGECFGLFGPDGAGNATRTRSLTRPL